MKKTGRTARKARVDELVVLKGIAPSPAKAQALVMAGEILVEGHVETKGGTLVPVTSEITLRRPGPRYVSRGGEKLAAALDHFGIDPKDKICLDIGASTGGFSDCLLQRGAKSVFAVDVGKGLLDPKIRNDPRVTWRESFHVKNLTPDTIGRPVDIAVVDVAFISLTKVLPFVLPCLKPKGDLVALIKPQFEGTRKDVEGTGVVKSEERRLEIVQRIVRFADEVLHLADLATFESPVHGTKGNREVFFRGRRK